MAQEIERKFLVRDDGWRETVTSSSLLRQGYLNVDQQRTVRIRTMDDKAWLTIKGKVRGTSRTEFEYQIPLDDALEMLDRVAVRPIIVKRRNLVPSLTHVWLVDEFQGANEGLILAEVELKKIDEEFVRPAWLGPEVTEDSRYYNNYLVEVPFLEWPTRSSGK